MRESSKRTGRSQSQSKTDKGAGRGVKHNEQDLLDRIQRFRPIDDTFFQVFADDVGVCQEILQVILQDKQLIVQSVNVQKDEHNLAGRSVRLDTLCELGDGTLCNIEIQRSDRDNHLKRMRYYASCITASETEPGEDFKNVPDVIVVYISEFDFLKGNKTIYHIESVIHENNQVVDNGLKMICVNTKIDDKTEIADLMRCFLQSEVYDDRFPQMSQRMSYLKQSEGGKRNMCKIMEEFAKDVIDEYSRERICNALRKGMDPLDLAAAFDVPIDYVMDLKDELDLNSCD